MMGPLIFPGKYFSLYDERLTYLYFPLKNSSRTSQFFGVTLEVSMSF